MPFRIYATNARGNTITRMDLNPNSEPINNRAQAELLAERWAESQTHGGPWTAHVEEYTQPTANPLWNRQDGAIADPVYTAKNINFKKRPGLTTVK